MAASDERLVVASRSTLLGVGLVAAMGMLSSVANIANEHFIKRRDMRSRFYAEQAALYSIGAILNGVCTLVWHGGPEGAIQAIIATVTRPLTLANVIAIALGGFSVGHVLRFADNIVNVIAHAVAMFMTAALGVMFLGQSVTVTWVCALTLLVVAIHFYHEAPRKVGGRAWLSVASNGDGGGVARSRLRSDESELSLMRDASAAEYEIELDSDEEL